jgi:hypothetical protein
MLDEQKFLVSFEKFLIKEFSLENLMAYKAIQAFEDEDDSGKALELAERIYREFCRPDSQMEVNISWDLREKIGAFFKEKPSCGDPSLAEANCFRQSRQSCFSLCLLTHSEDSNSQLNFKNSSQIP